MELCGWTKSDITEVEVRKIFVQMVKWTSFIKSEVNLKFSDNTFRVHENFFSAVRHRTDRDKCFVSPTENLLVLPNSTSQDWRFL